MKTKYNIVSYCVLVVLIFGISFSCQQNDDFAVVPEARVTPVITEVVPNSSDIGTTIVIKGNHFSRLSSNNQITFSGDAASIVTAATDSTLTLTVPEGAITGAITLKLAQFTVQSPVFNVVAAPVINSFTSPSGLAGDTVVINGENFGETTADNTVMFNGVQANVVSATTTSITVLVPDGATTGAISVTVLGQEAVSDTNFVFIPVINAFTPSTGLPNTEVVITGINFSANASDNTVSFNGVNAEVISASATSLTVLVPNDATEGSITVEVNGATAISTDDFVPIPPEEVTIEIPISAEEDDVEQSISTGTMALDSSDLELAEYDSFGSPDLGVQLIGLRFNTVNIPLGATILSASVQFTADDEGTDEAQLLIFGEDVGNAAPYIDGDGNVSNRLLTSQSAFWDIPAWPSIGDSGPDQRTVDISNIIQEIIDREDWTPNNSLNIIMRPTGNSIDETSTSGGREAEAGVGSDSAKLIITYLQ